MRTDIYIIHLLVRDKLGILITKNRSDTDLYSDYTSSVVGSLIKLKTNEVQNTSYSERLQEFINTDFSSNFKYLEALTKVHGTKVTFIRFINHTQDELKDWGDRKVSDRRFYDSIAIYLGFESFEKYIEKMFLVMNFLEWYWRNIGLVKENDFFHFVEIIKSKIENPNYTPYDGFGGFRAKNIRKSGLDFADVVALSNAQFSLIKTNLDVWRIDAETFLSKLKDFLNSTGVNFKANLFLPQKYVGYYVNFGYEENTSDSAPRYLISITKLSFFNNFLMYKYMIEDENGNITVSKEAYQSELYLDLTLINTNIQFWFSTLFPIPSRITASFKVNEATDLLKVRYESNPELERTDGTDMFDAWVYAKKIPDELYENLNEYKTLGRNLTESQFLDCFSYFNDILSSEEAIELIKSTTPPSFR